MAWESSHDDGALCAYQSKSPTVTLKCQHSTSCSYTLVRDSIWGIPVRQVFAEKWSQFSQWQGVACQIGFLVAWVGMRGMQRAAFVWSTGCISLSRAENGTYTLQRQGDFGQSWCRNEVPSSQLHIHVKTLRPAKLCVHTLKLLWLVLEEIVMEKELTPAKTFGLS
jgi:hypothetical protein